MTIATQIPSDRELLARYAVSRSDDDFRQLAERHLDWIYSVALRRTGKSTLAEEVTQGVLLTLSQKAASLQRHPSLVSWLFRATQYAASNLLRAEHRRHHYEREAMPTIAETTDPELLEKLDAAMNRLGAAEQEALLLRFYQRLPHAAVAAELRISEDAARQRINRAVEKLRKLLGVKSSATLAAALTGSLIVAAPKHLLALSAAPQALVVSRAIEWGFAIAKWKWAGALLVALIPIAIAAAVITARATPVAAPVAVAAPAPAAPVETTPPVADYSGIRSYRIMAYQEATADRPEHVTGVSYFDLDRGSLDTHVFTDTTYVARDDGLHAFKFRSNSPYIVQKNSDQPAAMRSRMMTMVLSFYRSQLTARHPEMDVVVNGEKLACWESDELVPPSLNSLQRNTIHIWLDGKGLPRRTATSTFNTLMGTTTKSRSEIAYNVEAPADTWAMPAKEIVDPTKLLEKMYSLAGAVFTHEAAGQTFAVHQVGRDENGTIYVVISTRVAEELRGKFAKLPQLMGHYSLPVFVSGGEGSRSVTLASIEDSGIHVKYLAIVGEGALTGELTSVEADPAPGKTESFRLSLPATAPAIAADAFVAKAYDAVRGVDGIATADLRVVVRNKKHRWTDVGKSVSEMSREEFLKESVSRLQDPTAP